MIFGLKRPVPRDTFITAKIALAHAFHTIHKIWIPRHVHISNTLAVKDTVTFTLPATSFSEGRLFENRLPEQFTKKVNPTLVDKPKHVKCGMPSSKN